MECPIGSRRCQNGAGWERSRCVWPRPLSTLSWLCTAGCQSERLVWQRCRYTCRGRFGTTPPSYSAANDPAFPGVSPSVPTRLHPWPSPPVAPSQGDTIGQSDPPNQHCPAPSLLLHSRHDVVRCRSWPTYDPVPGPHSPAEAGAGATPGHHQGPPVLGGGQDRLPVSIVCSMYMYRRVRIIRP